MNMEKNHIQTSDDRLFLISLEQVLEVIKLAMKEEA